MVKRLSTKALLNTLPGRPATRLWRFLRAAAPGFDAIELADALHLRVDAAEQIIRSLESRTVIAPKPGGKGAWTLVSEMRLWGDDDLPDPLSEQTILTLLERLIDAVRQANRHSQLGYSITGVNRKRPAKSSCLMGVKAEGWCPPKG